MGGLTKFGRCGLGIKFLIFIYFIFHVVGMELILNV